MRNVRSASTKAQSLASNVRSTSTKSAKYIQQLAKCLKQCTSHQSRGRTPVRVVAQAGSERTWRKRSRTHSSVPEATPSTAVNMPPCEYTRTKTPKCISASVRASASRFQCVNAPVPQPLHRPARHRALAACRCAQPRSGGSITLTGAKVVRMK